MDTILAIYNVLAHRKADVESQLVALAKRAVRKGVPFPTWSWGAAETHEEQVPHPEYGWTAPVRANVTRIPLTFRGDEPRHAGWRFVATLDWLPSDDGADVLFVRAINGASLPETYHAATPTCDHCRTNRNRRACYVLRHEDGTYKQVGSTCIEDFLGSTPFDVAAHASMLAEVATITRDDLGSYDGRNSCTTLVQYLPWVAACIREDGWVSGAKAYETGKMPTSRLAWNRQERGKDMPNEADHAVSIDALLWLETATADSDYMRNILAVAAANLVDARTMGVAASILSAYQRDMQRRADAAARAASVHVGTVGGKFSGRLSLAFQTTFENAYGNTYVYSFRDDVGNIVVWKASSNQDLTTGKSYYVRGTIKAHDQYKDAAQTVLTRCAVGERSCPCGKCGGSGKAKRGGPCKACDAVGTVIDFSTDAAAE